MKKIGQYIYPKYYNYKSCNLYVTQLACFLKNVLKNCYKFHEIIT